MSLAGNELKMAFIALLLVSFVATAVAQTISGPFDCEPAGAYTLCQNLWGRASGVGSQNSTLVSASGNTVSWSTNWNWQNGPNAVKSYANVEHQTAKGVKLSAISSLPATWTWTYQTVSTDVRADVSYDIWTGVPQVGNPASNASSYEIMIWLSGRGGIQPVGSQITTATPIAGYTWNLWSGPNANWHVYSFVSSTGDITNFSADLLEFFKYLIANQGVASSQYLQSIQAGTEPFTGNANLIINAYTVTLNQGGASSSTASSSTSVTTRTTTSTTVASSTATSTAPTATQTHYGQCGGNGYTGPTVCATGTTCQAVSPPWYSQCL